MNSDLDQLVPAFGLMVKSLSSGIRKKHVYDPRDTPRPIFQEMEFSPEIKPGYVYEAPPPIPTRCR
uniref:hypothetical protein n=1 Tax=Methylobacterium sp. B34 TaxID=95563 RepID=UPI0005B29A9D